MLAIVIYKKAMHSYFDALFQILLIEREEKDIRSFLKRYLESTFMLFIVNNTEVQILTGYSRKISTLYDDIDLPESLLTI